MSGAPRVLRSEAIPFPTQVDPAHLGLAVVTAGAVSAARVLLLGQWDEFKAATDASNRQVIPSIQRVDADIALVGNNSKCIRQ